jgi:hypothetical protein
MKGTERQCQNCGHRCHCYSPDCPECHNDICIQCQCDKPNIKDIPDSFIKGNT